MSDLARDKVEEKQFIPPEHWKCLDVAELEEWECPKTEWLIKDIIAKGTFNLVAAASQTGKSLLWLYICSKLLQGGKLFKRFDIKPIDKILYLALEDPIQRLRDRLSEVIDPKSIDSDRFKILPANDLNLSKNDHFDYLEKTISENGFQLVVLDTYQKATSGLDSYKDEAQSKILHRLANLTRTLNTTVVVIDHLRKPKNAWQKRNFDIEEIKGTGGKAQNADSVILMKRNDQIINVRVIAKDSDKQNHFTLRVNKRGAEGEKFEYVGTVDESKIPSKSNKELNREVVLEEFKKRGIASIPDVAKATKISNSTVGRFVEGFVAMSMLEKTGQGRNTKYEYINQDETIN